MPVNIHGKEYVTVAERLKEAGKRLISLNTEVVCIPNSDAVVIKATINIDGNTFTGISAANPSKTIEKMSPYEVAETSAVGRALGFAGFGVIDSIASADEMVKATDPNEAFLNEMDQKAEEPKKGMCATCGEPATIKSGVTGNKKWTGVFCSTGDRSHTAWA